MHQPQWLDLEGAVNVRDLGGLPAGGGRRTRSGVVVRSDAVHQLTGSDVAQLTGPRGIRHVVDLRAAGERLEQGRGLLGASGVVYSELDVLTDEMMAQRRSERMAAFAAADADPPTVMAEGYLQMLSYGKAAFVTALERLVSEPGAPALIHCSAGKDRTGVLVALLLDAVGVERAAIVADYAATEQRMAGVRSRLAAMPAYAQLAVEAPAMLLSAPAATMERFLDGLHATAGGAEAWFLAAGASPSLIAAWRDRILD